MRLDIVTPKARATRPPTRAGWKSAPFHDLQRKRRFDPDIRHAPSAGPYCSTTLAGAVAMRELARSCPQVGLGVVHPGVVKTDLGDRAGVLGMILTLAKRSWEAPEVCAARLPRILERPRWQHVPGEAPWLVDEREEPWPQATRQYAGEIMRALARDLPPDILSTYRSATG